MKTVTLDPETHKILKISSINENKTIRKYIRDLITQAAEYKLKAAKYEKIRSTDSENKIDK